MSNLFETRAVIFTGNLTDEFDIQEAIGDSMGVELIEIENKVSINKLMELIDYCIDKKLELTYYASYGKIIDIVEIKEDKKTKEKYISTIFDRFIIHKEKVKRTKGELLNITKQNRKEK